MQDTIRKENELLTTRIFNAPRELVYEAWTDPEHLAHWFGPDGFSITTEQFNAEPGGEWRFMMHGPDGNDFPNVIRFTKLESPSLIEYMQYADENTKGDAFFVTVSFSEYDGKTKLVMKMTFKSSEYLDYLIEEFGALEGQTQTLARLLDYLSKLKLNSYE